MENWILDVANINGIDVLIKLDKSTGRTYYLTGNGDVRSPFRWVEII